MFIWSNNISVITTYIYLHTYIYNSLPVTPNKLRECQVGWENETRRQRATTARRFSGVYTTTKYFVSERESTAIGRTNTPTQSHRRSKESAHYRAMHIQLCLCAWEKERQLVVVVCANQFRVFFRRAEQIMKNAIGHKTGLYIHRLCIFMYLWKRIYIILL